MNEKQNNLWPGWETVRIIGRGSFGTVYEIQRKLANGVVEFAALKVITIPKDPDDIEEMYSDGYDDESITATFRAHRNSIVDEYSHMQKMEGSANIVNCKDICCIQHDDGFGWDVFIRMELLTPLMKALPVNVSEDTVIQIGKDICNALVLCKKHEIVHRDIKPQNILISANGDYKLGDFGIAKTAEKTMGGTKIGTYKYMAPEVYNNQPYGSAADIYSLGLVLYWLLNERRMPFVPLPPARLTAGQDEEARSRRLSGEELPAPAHGSAALKQIVLKACAYDPSDRYASAAAMLEDLNKLGVAVPVVPPVSDADSADPSEDDATTGPVFGGSQDTDAIDPEDDDATVGPVFGGSQDTDAVAPADDDATVGPVFGGTQTGGDPAPADDNVKKDPSFAGTSQQGKPPKSPGNTAPSRTEKNDKIPPRKFEWRGLAAICIIAISLLASIFGLDILEENRNYADATRPSFGAIDETQDASGNTLDDDKQTNLAGSYDIKVWVPEIIRDVTIQQINSFNTYNNRGIIINATVESVNSYDAAGAVIGGITDGPDLYCFSQDATARLVHVAALAEPGADASEIIRANNDAGSVAAASVAGKLYAYPMTSDNAYFMYYDTSIISAEDAESLEAIIAACEKNNVKFRYALENAWYIASFFFATGCHSNWTMNEAGEFTAIDDDFNSNAGLVAMKGMEKLAKSPCYASNSEIFTDAGVVITGIWNANAAADHFGASLGVTDLPSFEVDGQSYHLSSFTGNTLMGVKPQTDPKRAAVLSLLAQYLTNEECQNLRYEKYQWGPSNKNAQASEAVQSNAALAALAKQCEYGVPQGQIHGAWWDIAKVLGADAQAADSEADLKAALERYNATIDALVSMDEEWKNAWSVIGGICGTSWDTDFAMTEAPAGTWTSDVLELKAGEELKVRKGAGWDVNFGGDGVIGGANLVVEADGKYKVQLVWDGAEFGMVTLIPVE